ncbi:flocculation protein FLO11 [Aplysia californica]|uniref:Flocculation protein FLO11 n=1 Tax=Aplysia californica TaxID=6500 RepID=A0ABM1A900_APLCA|nr:flocculation protein FLO11 [Aplysia californica]
MVTPSDMREYMAGLKPSVLCTQDEHGAASSLCDPIDLSNACRAFYRTRVESARRMKERWKEEEEREEEREEGENGTSGSDTAMTSPCRRRNSLDVAMATLRKEIASLMEQDLGLMRQLLTLNEEIESLKWMRRYAWGRGSCSSSSALLFSATSLFTVHEQSYVQLPGHSSLSLQIDGSSLDDQCHSNLELAANTQLTGQRQRSGTILEQTELATEAGRRHDMSLVVGMEEGNCVQAVNAQPSNVLSNSFQSFNAQHPNVKSTSVESFSDRMTSSHLTPSHAQGTFGQHSIDSMLSDTDPKEFGDAQTLRPVQVVLPAPKSRDSNPSVPGTTLVLKDSPNRSLKLPATSTLPKWPAPFSPKPSASVNDSSRPPVDELPRYRPDIVVKSEKSNATTGRASRIPTQPLASTANPLPTAPRVAAQEQPVLYAVPMKVKSQLAPDPFPSSRNGKTLAVTVANVDNMATTTTTSKTAAAAATKTATTTATTSATFRTGLRLPTWPTPPAPPSPPPWPLARLCSAENPSPPTSLPRPSSIRPTVVGKSSTLPTTSTRSNIPVRSRQTERTGSLRRRLELRSVTSRAPSPLTDSPLWSSNRYSPSPFSRNSSLSASPSPISSPSASPSPISSRCASPSPTSPYCSTRLPVPSTSTRDRSTATVIKGQTILYSPKNKPSPAPLGGQPGTVAPRSPLTQRPRPLPERDDRSPVLSPKPTRRSQVSTARSNGLLIGQGKASSGGQLEGRDAVATRRYGNKQS